MFQYVCIKEAKPQGENYEKATKFENGYSASN